MIVYLLVEENTDKLVHLTGFTELSKAEEMAEELAEYDLVDEDKEYLVSKPTIIKIEVE